MAGVANARLGSYSAPGANAARCCRQDRSALPGLGVSRPILHGRPVVESSLTIGQASLLFMAGSRDAFADILRGRTFAGYDRARVSSDHGLFVGGDDADFDFAVGGADASRIGGVSNRVESHA